MVAAGFVVLANASASACRCASGICAIGFPESVTIRSGTCAVALLIALFSTSAGSMSSDHTDHSVTAGLALTNEEVSMRSPIAKDEASDPSRKVSSGASSSEVSSVGTSSGELDHDRRVNGCPCCAFKFGATTCAAWEIEATGGEDSRGESSGGGESEGEIVGGGETERRVNGDCAERSFRGCDPTSLSVESVGDVVDVTEGSEASVSEVTDKAGSGLGTDSGGGSVSLISALATSRASPSSFS